MWKWVYGLAFGLIALVLALRVGDWMSRRGGTLPTLPNPNGYDEALSIASKITRPPADLAELSKSQIQQVANENRGLLDPVHTLVRGDFGVPLQTRRGWGEEHEENLKAMKRLAVALGIQSRAELLQGRTNGALRCHLDIILLGQAITQGGLILDGITGLTVETLGVGLLWADVPSMDAATCRSLVHDLERAESRRESPDRILQTEHRWSAASFGLVNRVGGWVLRSAEAKRRAQFTSRYHQTVRRTRRLSLLIASRAYELESGIRPNLVTDLVPTFISAVPIDPVTGAPFSDLPRSVAGDQ